MAAPLTSNNGTDLWLANQVNNQALNPTLNFLAGSSVQFNNLWMAWDGNSQNATPALNVAGGATVTFKGNAYMGGTSAFGNQGQGLASVSVADGGVMNVNSSAWFGGQSTLNLNNSGQLNVGGCLYLGGQGTATAVTMGAASQINMTGVGQTLGLADGDYSSFLLTNTPTGGAISVPTSTNLNIFTQQANATMTLALLPAGSSSAACTWPRTSTTITKARAR